MSFNDYLINNMQLMLLVDYISSYIHNYYYCTIIKYLLDDLPLYSNNQLKLMILQINGKIIKYFVLIILTNFKFYLK